ncbi:MAG: CCA tRNA nucleotidyltransferase [Candidatus Omnitrophota bacterium]|nr:CCA tRNA nucleotidyltransferase [Candidatus Omnitrophota bacterium]
MENLADKLNREPPEVLRSLKLISAIAGELGYPVYAVGGFVRDIILGVEDFDLDIVVEGDGINFTRELSRKLNVGWTAHMRFKTATIHIPGEVKIKLDVATARQEIYDSPAALPKVNFGSIKDDLKRRDFTINAMAIDISQDSFGGLVDFFDGRKDLRDKVLRVMHDLSFIDDPTRILRAVRFEQRFGFYIEPRTLKLLKESLAQGMLERVHNHRLRDELILILKEPDPVKSLKRIHALRGFKFIHPGLAVDEKTFALLKRINKLYQWFAQNFVHKHKHKVESWLLYLIVLLENLSIVKLKRTLQSFAFHKKDIQKVISFKKDAAKVIAKLKKEIPISGIHKILFPLSYEVVLLMLLRSGDGRVKRKIQDFLRVYSGIQIHLRGDELKELGVRPGPDFKLILKELLDAKLDGKFSTREEELLYLKNEILSDSAAIPIFSRESKKP